MARSHTTNITSMPQSVEDERHERMMRYMLMMGIRTACFLALIWVRGPWMLLFAAGAIFLPWFAVIIANAVRARRRGPVERPGAIIHELAFDADAAADAEVPDDGEARDRRAS